MCQARSQAGRGRHTGRATTHAGDVLARPEARPREASAAHRCEGPRRGVRTVVGAVTRGLHRKSGQSTSARARRGWSEDCRPQRQDQRFAACTSKGPQHRAWARASWQPWFLRRSTVCECWFMLRTRRSMSLPKRNDSKSRCGRAPLRNSKGASVPRIRRTRLAGIADGRRGDSATTLGAVRKARLRQSPRCCIRPTGATPPRSRGTLLRPEAAGWHLNIRAKCVLWGNS